MTGPCRLAAIVVSEGRTSAPARWDWDLAPRGFRVVEPASAAGAVDGLPDNGDETCSRGARLAGGETLTVDLGRTLPLTGVFYEPLLAGRGGCLIAYDLAVSTDAKHWTTLRENASFDNIVNNPIRRTVGFGRTVGARYVRLVPRRTQSGEEYGVGEFGVLTDRSRIPYPSGRE